MPLDVQRLLTSETWVLGSGDERAAAITLWLVSWHQVPAGSLPDNDRMLAHLAQSKNWNRVKAHALRGWSLADDGRMYHAVVAEKVLEAWLEKLAQRLSSGAGNAKRWGGEFDPAPIEQQMRDTRALLIALNPQSRTLAKKRTSGISKPSGQHPDGTKKDPGGMRPGVPLRSQETGTGTGIKDQELTPPDGGVVIDAKKPAPDDLPPLVLEAEPPEPPECPHTAIVAEFHRVLPMLPGVRVWDDDRKTMLRTRWREDPERQTVAWWTEFFEFVKRCPFLVGQFAGGNGHRPFLATLPWLVTRRNFLKVLEGNYEPN